MRIQLLVPEVRELLLEERKEDLVSVLQEMHPSDAAGVLSALDADEVVTILSLLPVELERDVFGYLEPEVQEQYVLGAGRERVLRVLQSMLSDDRAEFLERLDERVRAQIIPLLPSAAREDLLRRGKFADDQVGAFLSTDYAILNPALTARAAVAELRRQAPSKETIYYSYVLDRAGRLLGFVSLRDLILAREDQLVADLMKTDIVSVPATSDQETAAKLVRDYDLIALPVVDELGRLVGIVTHDDAVDIVAEEAAEDLEKLAGVTGESTEPEGLLAEPVLKQARRRAPVICLLSLFWLLTAEVIQGFEGAFAGASSKTLIALMPMVMAIGGMVGSQASTLIISSLAAGSLRTSLLRLLWNELRVSLLLAVVLAAIVFGNAILLQRSQGGDALAHTTWVAGVVAIAMLADVLFAAALGASIPHLVRVLKIDPALISTPAVTALTDLTGAAIYLALVTMMLA